MVDNGRRGVSRRTLLIAGGAGAAAVATGGVLATTRDPRPPVSHLRKRRAAGDFVIASPSRVLGRTALYDTTGAQSFAFDDAHGHLYTVQQVQDGLRLPGEPRAVRYADRLRRGDMCVSKLSLAGALLGHMYLRGFGHGISMGVEPSGAGVQLWVESRAHPETGYGRAVARVPFTDGTVLDSDSPAVRHHTPLPGTVRNHPALDLAGRRVLISHWAGKHHRYAVYGMDDFLAGRYEPLYTMRETARHKGEALQGCALHGDYIYQLTGNPYTDGSGSNPPESGGNTFASAIALGTGKTAGRRRITAAPSLPFREPEGIAVQLSPTPRLCTGFSTKTAGRRELSVYGFTE
ncbi:MULTISPECIES: signaling protein [unclassified Streptomyces]|uniref:phage baseplate protein n=1 Tax=unclassified Streptomyces TaxID=2593676 RepID=UPI002DD91590|nr:signaling protein [Streptomyces sp. NBC_01766]WSC19187.1 signaling protein [Streptomyces sp. NBC_01766]WSV53211.1 signaling protein [Streptomyces sp. NBC_01014]